MSETIPQPALDLIKEYESYIDCPYLCPANELTIGYGHVILEGETFNGYKAEHLLKMKTELLRLKLPRAILNDFLKNVFGNLLSEPEAYALMQEDILKHWNGVRHAIKVKLSDNQKSALMSLVFNVGVKNFLTSTLLKHLNLSYFQKASEQFDRWIYENKKPLNGLIRRRNKEQELFNKG